MSRVRRAKQIPALLRDSLGTLFGSKRRWPALPSTDTSNESMNSAIIALRERSFVQSREVGDVLSSFTTVQDMVNIGVLSLDGKTLEQRVADIEKRLADAGIP